MNALKQRILTGWQFTRWLYLAMGVAIFIQGIMVLQILGILLGLYFISMAVLGFGCASGACYTMPASKHLSETTVEYEEIN